MITINYNILTTKSHITQFVGKYCNFAYDGIKFNSFDKVSR